MTVLSPGVRPLRAVRRGTSRRQVLAAAVLVVGALLPATVTATASAAPEPGVLVIEGRGGTVGELVVPAGPARSFNPMQVVIDGGRTYAGVLLEPADGPGPNRSPVGAVLVRAFQDGTRNAIGLLGVDGALEPGRYRVTLFGDGPVSVRYVLDDRSAPGLRVTPRRSADMYLLGRSEPLVTGYDEARVELPRSLPAGRRAVQLRLEEGLQVGQAQMCALEGTECPNRLPVSPPQPVPVTTLPPGPTPGVSTGDQPRAVSVLHAAAPTPRTLLWSVEGYRDTDGKLRAAAIVF